MNIFNNKIIILLFFLSINLCHSNYYEFNYSATNLTSFNNLNTNNPVWGSNIDKNYLIIQSSPSKFGLDKLNSNKIYTKFEILDNYDLQLGLEGIINDLFSDFNSKIGISSLVNDKITLGIELELSSYIVKNYNSSNLLKINIGGVYNFDNKIYIGFLVKNLSGNSYSDAKNYKNQIFQLGLGIKLLNELAIASDLLVNINKSSAYIFSIKYSPISFIQTNISYCSEPMNVNFGTNIKLLKDIFFQISVSKYIFSDIYYNFGVAFAW
jgi:hypothetical protein